MKKTKKKKFFGFFSYYFFFDYTLNRAKGDSILVSLFRVLESIEERECSRYESFYPEYYDRSIKPFYLTVGFLVALFLVAPAITLTVDIYFYNQVPWWLSYLDSNYPNPESSPIIFFDVLLCDYLCIFLLSYFLTFWIPKSFLDFFLKLLELLVDSSFYNDINFPRWNFFKTVILEQEISRISDTAEEEDINYFPGSFFLERELRGLFNVVDLYDPIDFTLDHAKFTRNLSKKFIISSLKSHYNEKMSKIDLIDLENISDEDLNSFLIDDKFLNFLNDYSDSETVINFVYSQKKLFSENTQN